MSEEMKNDSVSFSDALKKALHLGGTLFAVTAVTGLLLGLVENITSKAILQAEIAARNEAYRLVLPDGKTSRKNPQSLMILCAESSRLKVIQVL